MSQFKKGDRVRMVHTADSFGVIDGPVEKSPVDGGPRQPVLWDRSGKVAAWSPAFLMPADSREEDDPEHVDGGSFGSRRGGMKMDANGIMIIMPRGLYRKKEQQMEAAK